MRKIYKIEVDCANCAAKMEDAVKKLPGIHAAVVNYLTQKMTLEFEDGADIAAIMPTVTKTCRKIDSDFDIQL